MERILTLHARHLTYQFSSPISTQPIWAEIGVEAGRYITDDRVNLMLVMTGGNIRDTVKMALGYIIQTLELNARNNRAEATQYRGEMERYRQLLQRYL
jgi:hypothetical protein